jgi:hypothetical protein
MVNFEEARSFLLAHKDKEVVYRQLGRLASEDPRELLTVMSGLVFD